MLANLAIILKKIHGLNRFFYVKYFYFLQKKKASFLMQLNLLILLSNYIYKLPVVMHQNSINNARSLIFISDNSRPIPLALSKDTIFRLIRMPKK